MHQRRGNPIKWKLYVNKANLNLSWILLSSTPAGAIFSESFRGEYMIITSSFTYPFFNAPGLAILSTVVCTTNGHWSTFQEKCLLSLVQAHWSSPMLQWSLSHHLLPCSNGLLQFIDLAAMKWLISFWTTNLRVLAEANGNAAIQTSQSSFTDVSGFWLFTFYLRLSTRPCHEWLGSGASLPFCL